MKTTRFIGNCQICERDQKLHVGRMVHHGYKRPGDGFILGDCPGVGQDPYEVSCDLVKSYRAGVEGRLANLESYLANLKAGKITYLRELRKFWFGRQPSEWVEYVAGVTAPHYWTTAVANVTYQTESSISQCKRDIELPGGEERWRISQFATMTHLETWDYRRTGGNTGIHLLIAYATTNVMIDAAWIEKSNPAYLKGRRERNASRDAIGVAQAALMADTLNTYEAAKAQLDEAKKNLDVLTETSFAADQYDWERLCGAREKKS